MICRPSSIHVESNYKFNAKIMQRQSIDSKESDKDDGSISCPRTRLGQALPNSRDGVPPVFDAAAFPLGTISNAARAQLSSSAQIFAIFDAPCRAGDRPGFWQSGSLEGAHVGAVELASP
jgi:hypothetical protein